MQIQSVQYVISAFAFQTNEKGQVVTKTSLLKQMEDLIEEPGLTCCICREGYKFQVHSSSRITRQSQSTTFILNYRECP